MKQKVTPMKPVALAVGAHPDDIEFGMAGTLLMLARAGWSIHYWTLANGSCGSRTIGAAQLIKIRRKEAQSAAAILGAEYHPSLVSDLEITYAVPLLRRVSALMREIKPSIVLTHSPQDYMEDHVNTCRLAVTAAFALGMPNFRTVPSRPAVELDTMVYHAMPHGMRGPLREPVAPEMFVNTTAVQQTKIAALGAHKSQHDWLDASQGMPAFLVEMEQASRFLGTQSGRYRYAEGWRRHSHLGFSRADGDPLHAALGSDCLKKQLAFA